MCTRVGQLLTTLIVVFVSLTRAQTSYQEWICRTRGIDLKTCDLECTDGLARPNGCEICACRESLCNDKSKVKCPEGWHCEVEQSGSAWFPVDVPTCVKAAPSEEQSTITTSTTSTTPTTITTTSTTTTTTTTTSPPAKTTKTTAIVAQTCEQRGRCDETGSCDDASYVCRSDGRCCRPDKMRPEPQADIPRCQQKPSIGVCRAYAVQYVYDINIGKCTETIFGGCVQSGNSFVSLEECKEICEKPCEQPQSDGPCRANIPRFYFDFDVNRCLLFDYGGCHGNSNNFATVEECDIQCSGLGKTGVSVYSSKYRSNAKSLISYSGKANKGNNNEESNADSGSSEQNGGISIGFNALNNDVETTTLVTEINDSDDENTTSNNDQGTANIDGKDDTSDSQVESGRQELNNETNSNMSPINSIIESYKTSKPIGNPNSLAFSANNDEQDPQPGTSTDGKPDNTDDKNDSVSGDTGKDNSEGQTRKLSDFLNRLLGRG